MVAAGAGAAVAAAAEAAAGGQPETSTACSLAGGLSGAWVIPVGPGSSGKTSTAHRLALGSDDPLHMYRMKTG